MKAEGIFPEETENSEIPHGLGCVCVILRPEINLELSSASWLQQRRKEKVILGSNRQIERLPTPPAGEANILNLSCYLSDIMG